MAKTLLICPHCNETSASPLVFSDLKSFEHATRAGNVVTCPKCRQLVHCDKGSLIFKEDE
ncbi:hypothetical protein MNBD_GAMMA26-29 [hydrothermal vent metagenome]|uniref:Uncharacterized protein n=1 Tax=hydrothermal vent metagenome TaxID=652676 RepID=A0A3B1BHR9_9ZZZZ